MQFAIIKTGGKQYRVKVGDTVTIEKLNHRGTSAAIPAGEKVTFDDVLLTDDGTQTVLGTPLVAGASVSGTIEVQGKERTLIISKFKNKTNYRKRIGHRHRYTRVKIEAINT